MGNKILKIVLPLVVFVVILLVIVRTQKSIDEIASGEVATFDFSEYINEMIRSDLKNKPYDEAKKKYRCIYDIIKTEEQLSVTDKTGHEQPMLRDTTAQGCYRRVFAEYWPAFEGMVAGVFKSDWSRKTDQMSVIKSEVEDLQQRKGTSLRNDSLKRYLGYVSDYKAAYNFVKNVSCSSKNGYEDLLDKKERYMRKYPLCNNGSLVDELQRLPETAKRRWKRSILRKVDETCEKSNLEDFVKEKNGCDSKISEYNDYFFNDKLDDDNTTVRLKNRWCNLLEYVVYNACEINDFKEFYKNYANLKDKIGDYENAYSTDLKELKDKLEKRREELEKWNNGD